MENKFYIFSGAEAMALDVGSLYRDTQPCRDDLMDFFLANEWFGREIKGAGRGIFLDACPEIEPALSLWLRAYRRTGAEKMDLLCAEYHARYPETCGRFAGYLRERGGYGKEGGLRVLDFLLSELDKDITGYSEEELQPLLRDAGEYLAVANEEMLLDFLKYLKEKGRLEMEWDYEMHGKRVVQRENSAYSLKDFSLMAYMVFNPESWEENGLLEKAAEVRRYADMWLFISLHFICGLRGSDMALLPAPELPYPGHEMRRRILERSFCGAAASELAGHWVYLAGLTARHPHKTQAYSGVPEIKFYIPESLLEPMGIILAMALSHHKDGDACVKAGAEKKWMEDFFGGKFAEAAGKRRFGTRRANKAYLQGIEGTAAPEPGSAKGYMLAALARSHKGGIGTLAKVTEIYLEDAAFTGYTPEFVLMEMFERGVFGFIPAMLMDAYSKDSFRSLGLSAQNPNYSH